MPDRILTLPIIAAFVISIAHFISLYRLRVRASFGEMAGRYLRPCRCNGRWRARSAPAVSKNTCRSCARPKAAWRAKAPISGLLGSRDRRTAVAGAITLVATNYKQVREIDIFAAVLVVQSLPFLAAVALAGIEGSRFNSFVFWRGVKP